MPFLPSLRMSGIFDRSSSGGRPFGQPNTGEDIDLGSLMRLIGPTSESLKNDDMRRQQEMMQFEKSLNSRPRPAPLATNNLVKTKKNVVLGPQGGFGALQSRFQKQADVEDQQEFSSGERALDRGGAMDLAKLRESGEMERIGRDLAGRKDLSMLEGDLRLNLERERTKSANEAAALEHTRNLERDRQRAVEERETNRVKPVTGAAATMKDQNLALQGKIQELSMRNPALGNMIVEDPNTGRLSLRGGTPADHEQIRNFLFSSPTKTAPAAPKENPVREIQRRNKSTGEVQSSADGGKTWRTVSPGKK